MAHLVRSRGTSICNDCVLQAHDAIASAPPDQRMLRIRPARGQVEDRDAAEDGIEQALQTVFDSELPSTERCKAIAGGEDLAPTIEELVERYPPADHVDVSVDAVRFVSDDEAEVHFTLHLAPSGPSALAQTGYAVLVDGAWKLARETWCRLVAMVGVSCPPSS